VTNFGGNTTFSILGKCTKKIPKIQSNKTSDKEKTAHFKNYANHIFLTTTTINGKSILSKNTLLLNKKKNYNTKKT